MWIDTHAHLDAPEFADDRDAVVAAIRAAGVRQVVIPAVMASNFETVRALAHRYDLSYALGIHPMGVPRSTEGKPQRGKHLIWVNALSELRQRDAPLAHIFAGAIGIARLAGLVAFEEQKLAGALVGVDLGGQRRGV
jgi:Tat protein secretion system quality control protein TatD with DNase activity